MASSKTKRTKAATGPTRTVTGHYDFEVAFSFLDQDKSLALSLEAKLQPFMNVFVYATRQQILAGTEGLESFRQIFLAKSRLVVVLYRAGWGETRFTRIEEQAIRDRGFDQHWEDFLLFVTMKDDDPVPGWLPKHHIRLSYPVYGPDQLVGAIKVRAQNAGAIPKVENAVEKAIRLDVEARRREERQKLLSGSGGELGLVQSEAGIVFDALEKRLADLQSGVPSLKLEWRRDQVRSFAVRSSLIGMNIVPNWDYPLNESKVRAFKFVGPIKFDDESGVYIPGPKHVGTDDYGVDYDQAYGGWCWKLHGKLLSTSDAAEQMAHEIVELHGRASRGEIKITLDDFWPGR